MSRIVKQQFSIGFKNKLKISRNLSIGICREISLGAKTRILSIIALQKKKVGKIMIYKTCLGPNCSVTSAVSRRVGLTDFCSDQCLYEFEHFEDQKEIKELIETERAEIREGGPFFPIDYEACSECGFDHSYEYEHAERWHNLSKDKEDIILKLFDDGHNGDGDHRAAARRIIEVVEKNFAGALEYAARLLEK